MMTQPEVHFAAGTARRCARPAETATRPRRVAAPTSAAPAPDSVNHAIVRAVMEMAPTAMALVNRCGEVVHANRAFAQLLECGGNSATMRAEVGWRAPFLASRTEKSGHDGDTAAEGEVRLSAGTVRLRASVLPCARPDEAPTVLFVLEVLTPEPASICREQLRARWGLTEQECQVACLIAEGRSDKAVARVLEISAHTARHHGEHVRSKLGVSSRTEVAARLLKGM